MAKGLYLLEFLLSLNELILGLELQLWNCSFPDGSKGSINASRGQGKESPPWRGMGVGIPRDP